MELSLARFSDEHFEKKKESIEAHLKACDCMQCNIWQNANSTEINEAYKMAIISHLLCYLGS